MARKKPAVVERSETRDSELLLKVAAIYGMEGASVTRGPTRAYDFAGLITITSADRKLAVKQGNFSGNPLDPLMQAAVRFHKRFFDLGGRTPAPVVTSDGTHGTVKVESKQEAHLWAAFTAAEFIEGECLEGMRVNKRDAERYLYEAGIAGGLSRVATQNIGQFDRYGQDFPEAWEQRLSRARELNRSWAGALEGVLPVLVRAQSQLPLDTFGSVYLSSPDLAPKDVMIDARGEIWFVDFERIWCFREPLPLNCSTGGWFDWAERNGVDVERAASIIASGYRSTLRQHGLKLPIQRPADSPLFRETYNALVGDISWSLHPGRILERMREDADARIPHEIETTHYLARQHLQRRATIEFSM